MCQSSSVKIYRFQTINVFRQKVIKFGRRDVSSKTTTTTTTTSLFSHLKKRRNFFFAVSERRSGKELQKIGLQTKTTNANVPLFFCRCLYPDQTVKSLMDLLGSLTQMYRKIYTPCFPTSCSLDILLHWAVKVLIFRAAWAEITNQPKSKQITCQRGYFMYHRFL
jgi:hypothetical protein